MSGVRGEDGEIRYLGSYAGFVVENEDPEKRGRVKAKIPGLVEPSTDWALPVGGAHSSGESRRGGFDPPKVGAAVVVRFLAGEIDSPIYEGGWRGAPNGQTDAPTIVGDASPADAANKLKVYESDKFVVCIDERTAGGEVLSLRGKTNGVEVDVYDGKKVEVKAGGTLVRVLDKKIQLGGNATEAIFKGTARWEAELEWLNQLLAAFLGLQMAAGLVSILAPLEPGLGQIVTALNTYIAKANKADGFLSKLSFTE